MIRIVSTEKGEVTYRLERKSVKNLNLRVKGDGSVFVSVPKRISVEKADEFVKAHMDFILKHKMRIDKSSKMTQQFFLGEKIERVIKQGEKAFAQFSNKVLTIYLPASAFALSEDERKELIKEITACWEKKMGQELFPQFLNKAYQR